MVGAIGIAVVALHNLVGPLISAASGGHWLWALLYERGRACRSRLDVVFAVNFPPLPLFGLMAAG